MPCALKPGWHAKCLALLTRIRRIDPRPLHHQPAYDALCSPESCPESVKAAARVLSLPMSADLAEGDQERVVAAIRSIAGVRPRESVA